MPNYEEIIKQSQDNVKSLSEKLKDLDKLYQDIDSIKSKSEGIPLAFEQNFQKISELSKQYTETLGAASKTYLEGSNTLFTNKLNDLADKNSKLEKEISRLVNTDLTKLFNDLQKVFIEQTKIDLEIELKKIGEKTNDFQTKITSFGGEIDRLEEVDLEGGFRDLQMTLANIFKAINSINTSLLGITTSLNTIVQSLGSIQTSIDANYQKTDKQLNVIQKEVNKNTILILEELKLNTEENVSIKKEQKLIKILTIVGFMVVIFLQMLRYIW